MTIEIEATIRALAQQLLARGDLHAHSVRPTLAAAQQSGLLREVAILVWFARIDFNLAQCAQCELRA